MLPSTVTQLAILVLLVVPGIMYQSVRDQLLGPLASEQDLGHRVLRALAAGLLLDTCYVLIAGPWLVRLVGGTQQRGLTGLVERPRLVALVGFVLLLLVPAAVAALESLLVRRRRSALYSLTPTAWDFVLRGRGNCFVRFKLKDGTWVGGWYGSASYASAFPHPRDIYLESQWTVRRDGTFGARMPDTLGVYIPATDVAFIEFLDPPAAQPDGTS